MHYAASNAPGPSLASFAMLRTVLSLVLVTLVCGGALAEPKKKASGGAQRSEMSNTERELVDALQSQFRNAKGKVRRKAKVAK